MNEQESKARLIVKRIITHLVDKTGELALKWNEIPEPMRQLHMQHWAEIATEVLGEEGEPMTDEAMVDKLCTSIGYDDALCRIRNAWMRAAPESAWSLGPPSELLVSCGCGGNIDCGWCEGTDKVTTRVKQAKEEAERPKGETDKHSDRVGWNDYIFQSGWTESFIKVMRDLGAVRVQVPASQSGSFLVDFEIGRGGTIWRQCKNPDCKRLTEFTEEMAKASEIWTCSFCGSSNAPGMVFKKPTIELEDLVDKEKIRSEKG